MEVRGAGNRVAPDSAPAFALAPDNDPYLSLLPGTGHYKQDR